MKLEIVVIEALDWRKMKPKYKWLRIRNRWTGKLIDDLETRSEIDNLPTGWYIAFGEQMIDELNELLVKYKFDDKYMITQIKEKYGTLRWYDNGIPIVMSKEYLEWQRKYTELSAKTCIVCGKKGVLRKDLWWIEPLCLKHYREREKL